VVVSVDAGPGEDVVVIGSNGGTSAAALIPDFAIDGGAGLDGLIIDSSADFLVGRTATVSSGAATGNVAFGSGTSFHHTDVEGVIGRMGSGADTVNVSNTEGYTALAAEGGGGNDTLNVAPSTLFGSFEFDGGSGTNDTVNAGDGGAAGGTYLVGSQSIGRSGFSLLKLNSSTERLTLTTGSGADQIYKTGARPATLNAGGGDDLISARDSVGDTANCGAGSDFVLSDSLDTLNDCEASDRTLAQPPPTTPTDPGTGTETGTTGTGTENTTPPPQPQDRAAPTAGISGLKSTVRLKALLKGLTGKVVADESASYEVTLLGSTSSVRLARSYNVTLARQSIGLGLGPRDLKLRPSKRLIGRARKFTVRVVVTPTDAAGNRGKPVTKTLKVKP